MPISIFIQLTIIICFSCKKTVWWKEWVNKIMSQIKDYGYITLNFLKQDLLEIKLN